MADLVAETSRFLLFGHYCILWLLPPSLLVGVLVAFHVGDTVIEVEQSNGSMIKVRIGDVVHTPKQIWQYF
jgi:hypothetical protein